MTKVEGEKNFRPGIFRPTLGFSGYVPSKNSRWGFSHTGRFLLGRWESQNRSMPILFLFAPQALLTLQMIKMPGWIHFKEMNS